MNELYILLLWYQYQHRSKMSWVVMPARLRQCHEVPKISHSRGIKMHSSFSPTDTSNKFLWELKMTFTLTGLFQLYQPTHIRADLYLDFSLGLAVS